MKFDIKTKNITLTDSISTFVDGKLASFDAKVKRFGTGVTGEIEVGMTSKHHKKGPIFRAEIHIRLPNKLIYAQSEDLNLYTAIVSAKKEAEHQLAVYKSEKTGNNLRLARKSKGGRT
jgi:ribosomal subunit interface protein